VSLLGRLTRRMLATPAYWWAGMLLLVLIAGLVWVSRTSPVQGAYSIRQAEVEHQQTGVPVLSAVALPHVWDDQSPRWEGEARYRLPWPADLVYRSDRSRDLALLLPRVGARYRVWLNGQEVADRFWAYDGFVDTSLVPQIVNLPHAWLAPVARDNRLEIEVRGQPLRKSGLSLVQVGEANALQKRFAQLMWWQVYATWMVAAVSLMLGLMSLLLWLNTRERLFGLLAAATFAWTIRLGLTPLETPPMSFEVWYYLQKLSFTAYCGFLFLFMWDLFEYRQGPIRSFVHGLLFLGPVWLAVTVYFNSYTMYQSWMAIITLTSVVALVKLFHRARWGLDANQRLMVVFGAATMATGVRDFAVVNMGLPGDADIRWMTVGSLMLMYALGWVLVRRVSAAMEQVRLLNAELSRKVGEREDELQRLFEQLRLVESQRVLDTERRRLTRDMHDGLGSQLVQALNVVRGGGEQVDSSAVAAMLNHALEDLRMTLDSLEPMEGDLTTILGTLRQRIAPALQAARIELDWQVQEVPAVPGLEARGVLHVFRCLQEVFANVLKHAQAQRVTVSTRDLGGQVELCVRDDGVGLGQLDRRRVGGGGRGMGNIRLRAAELGVAVSFEDARPGTCVRFLFPLQQSGALVTG
jgi:signal transduction histidine kinase